MGSFFLIKEEKIFIYLINLIPLELTGSPCSHERHSLGLSHSHPDTLEPYM